MITKLHFSYVPQLLSHCGERLNNMDCKLIFLFDESVSVPYVQEGGTTHLPKEQMNNCLQIRSMLLARGRGLQLPPWYHVCCQTAIGRLPRDFPHSRFRGRDGPCSDEPEKRENKGAAGVA